MSEQASQSEKQSINIDNEFNRLLAIKNLSPDNQLELKKVKTGFEHAGLGPSDFINRIETWYESLPAALKRANNVRSILDQVIERVKNPDLIVSDESALLDKEVNSDPIVELEKTAQNLGEAFDKIPDGMDKALDELSKQDDRIKVVLRQLIPLIHDNNIAVNVMSALSDQEDKDNFTLNKGHQVVKRYIKEDLIPGGTMARLDEADYNKIKDLGIVQFLNIGEIKYDYDPKTNKDFVVLIHNSSVKDPELVEPDSLKSLDKGEINMANDFPESALDSGVDDYESLKVWGQNPENRDDFMKFLMKYWDEWVAIMNQKNKK